MRTTQEMILSRNETDLSEHAKQTIRYAKTCVPFLLTSASLKKHKKKGNSRCWYVTIASGVADFLNKECEF